MFLVMVGWVGVLPVPFAVLALLKVTSDYITLIKSRESLDEAVSQFTTFYRSFRRGLLKLSDLQFYGKNSPKVRGEALKLQNVLSKCYNEIAREFGEEG